MADDYKFAPGAPIAHSQLPGSSSSEDIMERAESLLVATKDARSRDAGLSVGLVSHFNSNSIGT